MANKWKADGELKPCKCGCGTLVQGEWKRGHARRGRKNSPEHCLAIARSKLGKPMHPSTLEALKKANTGSTWKPGRKAHHSEFMLKHWSENVHPLKGKPMPEDAARRSAASRKGLKQSEEECKRKSVALKAKWAEDPEYRERMKKIARSPEQRERQRLFMLEQSKNPEFIQKLRTYRRSPHGILSSRRGAIAARKSMASKMSKPERRLMGILTEIGIPFESQRPLMEIEHFYPCDFFIPSKNLVVECDGTYFHKFPYGRPLDHTHDQELWEAGFHVLRFWENNFDLETVRESIESVPDVIRNPL